MKRIRRISKRIEWPKDKSGNQIKLALLPLDTRIKLIEQCGADCCRELGMDHRDVNTVRFVVARWIAHELKVEENKKNAVLVKPKGVRYRRTTGTRYKRRGR